jgi:geranylgeranyl pyrophosphate synthase
MARGTEAEPATSSFEAVIVAGGARVADLLEHAEQELEAAVRGFGPTLADHSLATLSAGGKRLRPLLVFLCGTPSSTEELVRVGVAVELLHMATLVHDDVVDAAPLRRGQPTVVASAGRGAALRAGDFLFARALSVLAHNDDAEQSQVLADACLALAQGEFAQREDAYAPAVSEERYLHRCDLKTARLFSAACMLGALACERGPQQVRLLGGFGRSVGVAFQILDDVLDVSGPVERTGKRRGTDLLEGTTTLPLILARQRDSVLRELDLRELRDDPGRAELVCDRIAATGALVEARRRALKLVSEATASLEGQIDAELAQALATVADGVVDRYT